MNFNQAEATKFYKQHGLLKGPGRRQQRRQRAEAQQVQRQNFQQGHDQKGQEEEHQQHLHQSRRKKREELYRQRPQLKRGERIRDQILERLQKKLEEPEEPKPEKDPAEWQRARRKAGKKKN